MALPVLTPEQRTAALAKAAEARTARSKLLAAVKSGELSVADVLAKAENDEIVKKTKVSALIKALPADPRRIGGLGANQREALLAAVAS